MLTVLPSLGERIFRNGDWVFASEFQEHEFDCPFQLGCGCRRDHPIARQLDG